MAVVPLIVLSGFAVPTDAGKLNGLAYGLRPMEKEEEADEKEEEDGVAFSLLVIGNGAVDERLREKRREKRRSPDGGDVICPTDETGVLTSETEQSMPRVFLSPSRPRLPRNLFRMDFPVRSRVRRPEFLLK